MAITTIAITASLGLWNAFSTPENKPAAIAAAAKPTEPPPTPLPQPSATPAPQPTPTAPGLALRPVKIIFGGKAPQQQVIQVIPPVAEATGKNNRRQNNNQDNNSPAQSDPVPSNPPATGSS